MLQCVPRDDRARRARAGPRSTSSGCRRQGIQSAFQFYNINSFETVERMIRRGVYKGPLVMNWVAIGGGMDAPNIYNLANFLRATPDGAVLTLESSMRNVLPINMMAIAMGLHVRCGIEDNLWTQDRKSKMSTVKQIEQLVRISREFGREIATGKEARRSARSTPSTTASKRRWRRTASRRTAQPVRLVAAGCASKTMNASRPDRAGPARSRGEALADPARSRMPRADDCRAHGSRKHRSGRARRRDRSGCAEDRRPADHRRP